MNQVLPYPQVKHHIRIGLNERTFICDCLFIFVVSPKQPDTKEDNKKDNDKVSPKKHIKNPFSGALVAW
jgi:hypothetical protein